MELMGKWKSWEKRRVAVLNNEMEVEKIKIKN